ncbi:hypothetical protein BX666DRAFT_2004211 [Dichotomocladium elegans]|nr:hypothetical protein BX666DRAFT_2004211 [Dichotomocladium elegans]
MNEPLPPRPGSLASSEALPMMDRRGGVHPATGPLRPPVQMNRIDPWLTSMLQREYTNDVEGDKDTASDDSLSISALSLSSRPSGSDDALHSRPPSPIAPGLPPAIPLQPQPQSSGLFEEEGYCGCASPMSIHSDSTRSLHSIHTLASSSIWPPSRPLVVDPYPSSVEAHYYHAALPPPPPIRSLPQTVSSPVSISSSQWYYGDSDDDADGTMPV